ncbi:DUF262 domain-containing protein [Stutzerimonas nitrititolerans]|uniref:DUF262 domain-containing protein n=1 Tax=Stutzerimonas nitrititolerans TaxID=2482751 RepID=UPI0007189164|nr:DUF262 domain-containing protein [Stutzerimonas nitrititolerans]KRW67779.1 hypothetical protein AO735_07280 [Pseudomonas sp. TTU2014-096BSC]MBA1183580.1 DUF262 domain-containing protein [Stutzerimonas stutzeri]
MPSTLKDNLDNLQNLARERTVKTQNIEFDLETIIKRIEKGIIKLDPDYQRRHRWSDELSSRLIESLLLNIPVPVIYISQDVDVDEEADDDVARFTIIDGQQRLTAIYRFMKGELELAGLETLKAVNGLRYKQLPPFLLRRLDERTVKCLRIDSTLDPQVKYDIFERLNTGSVKLEAQELRNATTRGPFNDALKRMASDTNFRKMLQIPLDDPDSSAKVKKMEDLELVLRFFALRNGQYKDLSKGLKNFLTEKMDNFNHLSTDEIAEMEKEFKEHMSFLEHALGSTSFAKYSVQNGKIIKRMSSFNAAVFDAVSVGAFDYFTRDQIKSKDPAAISRFQHHHLLFEDLDFFSAVSGATADTSKVKYRIEKMIEHLAQ